MSPYEVPLYFNLDSHFRSNFSLEKNNSFHNRKKIEVRERKRIKAFENKETWVKIMVKYKKGSVIRIEILKSMTQIASCLSVGHQILRKVAAAIRHGPSSVAILQDIKRI
ncbi:hypothetical protein TNCV_2816581 [Trichonephila clavipes]|nr:hypothetical protein TNCV_2816581 [Trichonephila clavipes]